MKNEEKDTNADAFFDPADVCCLVPLNKRTKQLFNMFFEAYGKKSPDLKKGYEKNQGGTASNYSSEYVLKIINVMAMGETMGIETNKDYPITFTFKSLQENPLEFRIILAPRVGGDYNDKPKNRKK